MKKFQILVMLLCICCLSPLAASPVAAAEIRLSVAASLKEVITELADGFARATPGARFVKNFGASGVLAKQIENGAPADIFISANHEWVWYLRDRRLLDSSTITVFAYNSLVFAGTPAKRVASMADLVKLDKIAVGSPKSVPAGEYAMQAIKAAGLEKQLEKKLVMARDVRDCLMYADRGEVDGAFVYRTDALQARSARVLFTVPQKLYPEVVYPMALTITGARSREAIAFFSYLRSPEAKGVLKKYGFALQ